MGKRATGLKQHVKSKNSPKTKKRLAVKAEMLKNKASKKKRK